LSYEEFPVFFPMGSDHLLGIVCAPEKSETDTGVVLLTGGNYTRSHRNRMWVTAARVLAEAGFPSIRVDYHGVGDSTGRARFDMEEPFVEDAVAAADFLTEATGVSRLTFLATCFGGRTAMAAAARHEKGVMATIFPVPLFAPRSRTQVPLRTKVKVRIRRWGWGKKLFSRPRIRRLRNAAAARRSTPEMMVSPKFKRDLTDFVRRGDVWFVYGDQSYALNDLKQLLAETKKHLSRDEQARIHVKILPNCAPEHLRSIANQELIVQCAIASVTGELDNIQIDDGAVGANATG
jgi:alpha/beta superfamily hydrolase